jgi:hypothetical protein
LSEVARYLLVGFAVLRLFSWGRSAGGVFSKRAFWRAQVPATSFETREERFWLNRRGLKSGRIVEADATAETRRELLPRRFAEGGEQAFKPLS